MLNGGFKGWVEAGYPTTKEVPKPESAQYKVSIRKEMLATYEEIKEIVANKKKSPILIDSREKARYLGKEEPIDKIPGHIPGPCINFGQKGWKMVSSKEAKNRKKICRVGSKGTNYCLLRIRCHGHAQLYSSKNGRLSKCKTIRRKLQ